MCHAACTDQGPTNLADAARRTLADDAYARSAVADGRGGPSTARHLGPLQLAPEPTLQADRAGLRASRSGGGISGSQQLSLSVRRHGALAAGRAGLRSVRSAVASAAVYSCSV